MKERAIAGHAEPVRRAAVGRSTRGVGPWGEAR
jgi:hypothetical protein